MAEKEYIERAALLEEMQDCKYAEPSNDFQRGVNASVDILIAGFKHLPATDVEEVVRCKDCRFRFDGCCLEPRNRIVFRVPDFGDHYSYARHIMVAEDHFCGYGERNETNHG